MKFSVKDFFSKCGILSHLLKKFSIKNFSFCAEGLKRARLPSLNILMTSEL